MAELAELEPQSTSLPVYQQAHTVRSPKSTKPTKSTHAAMAVMAKNRADRTQNLNDRPQFGIYWTRDDLTDPIVMRE
ncbi:hypothetical protein VMCG_04258 [Cytospora schulzeri]|uniref:Uncharacterized protein n=1 Tax=Cytospora schulzeri TaxID=448051 RepID=A0A423WSV0_9PEZI|nr:hypothetical protein VMCG_04258 [Valsa malicola]